MKLVDWAEKQGISYLTAYRWFKGGKLPVKAYQSASGTIIIEDQEFSGEQVNNQSNDAVSSFIKKTVEFSKNKGSIEDFAAYILTNFSLKSNNIDVFKHKPKQEDIQKHFKQFIKLGEKPQGHMFVAPDDTATHTIPNMSITIADVSDPLIQDLYKDIRIDTFSSAPDVYSYSNNNGGNLPIISNNLESNGFNTSAAITIKSTSEPAIFNVNNSVGFNLDQIDRLKVIDDITLKDQKQKRGRKPVKK